MKDIGDISHQEKTTHKIARYGLKHNLNRYFASYGREEISSSPIDRLPYSLLKNAKNLMFRTSHPACAYICHVSKPLGPQEFSRCALFSRFRASTNCHERFAVINKLAGQLRVTIQSPPKILSVCLNFKMGYV